MKKHPLDIGIHVLTRTIAVCLMVFCFLNIYLEIHAEDLLEQAFAPAKTYQTIADLGNTKNAVGNEIFVASVQSQDSLGYGCFVNGTRMTDAELNNQISSVKSIPIANIGDADRQDFCQQILGGDWNVPAFTQQEPLLIRVTKWLLRITIVLSITMVIYNGIGYIIESAKGGEVKNATKNIMLIVWGLLLALLSLVIINLLRSLTLSSLWLWG